MNWCLWTVLLEETLENLLDCKEIQLVNPRKSILNIHWKDWCWSWSSNTLATWWEEPTHWKRPWCWERLKAGDGDDRGWVGWMASLTQWREIESMDRVWANSRRGWRTGKPAELQFMGSYSVRHNWVTEQQEGPQQQASSLKYGLLLK